MPKGERETSRDKKNSKNFKKTLDKPLRLWYNKYVKRVATNARKVVDTMASTKLTNKSALNYVLDNYDVPTDVATKLKAMIAAIERKSSAPKKPTAVQVANENLKAVIVDFLTVNAENGYTVTDLIKSVEELADLSNQKVSALLRLLKEDGKVVPYSEKRKTYFKIA